MHQNTATSEVKPATCFDTSLVPALGSPSSLHRSHTVVFITKQTTHTHTHTHTHTLTQQGYFNAVGYLNKYAICFRHVNIQFLQRKTQYESKGIFRMAF